MANNIEVSSQSAQHFLELKACGVFGLIGQDGEVIGTLVIDSRTNPYFFSSETVALVQDLVARAQRLMEQMRQLERLRGLLDTMPAEVAVFDPNGLTSMSNQAWVARVGKGWGKVNKGAYPFASAARCVGDKRAQFENSVLNTFRTQKSDQLVAEFRDWENHHRKMQANIIPWEKSESGRTESVIISLMDISRSLTVKNISVANKPTANLSDALNGPLETIRETLQADRAVVVEFLGSAEDKEVVRRWSVANRKKNVDDPELDQVVNVGEVGWLRDRLENDSYLAVGDIAALTPGNSEPLMSALQQGSVRAFLAVPIHYGSEAWGAVVVEYAERNCSFGAGDIDLLRDAASQLSLLILMSQRLDLRQVSEDMVRGIETGDEGIERLLRTVLEHAQPLATCVGGHIREIDWAKEQATIKANTDPYLVKGKTDYRRSVRLGERMAGAVALTGTPHVVQDVNEEEFAKDVRNSVPPDRDDLKEYLTREKSYVCMPIVVEDEILGTFSLSAEQTNHFTEFRLNVLQDLIRSAGLAIRTAQQIERLQKMVEEANVVLKAETLVELWSKLPEVAACVFMAEDAMVSSYDANEDVLRREAVHDRRRIEAGEPIGQATNASSAPGSGLMRYVAKTGHLLVLEGDELRGHRHLSRIGKDVRKVLGLVELGSVMVARLDTPEGKPVGVIKVENRKGRLNEKGFTPFDVVLMKLLATKFAIAIERLQLYENKHWAIISQTHDLKTPMQAVRSVVYNLAEGIYQLPQHMSRIRSALRFAKILDVYVINMLDLALNRLGPNDARIVRVDTHELISEVSELFADWQEQDNWDLGITVNENAFILDADRNMLFRILVNLIDNARKYGLLERGMKDGLPVPKVSIEVSVWTEDGNAFLSVADHGPGLKAIRRPRISADRDQQVQKQGGHGAGLAAVRLYARAHKGDVEVRDRSDGEPGAQAVVHWPQKSREGATWKPAN